MLRKLMMVSLLASVTVALPAFAQTSAPEGGEHAKHEHKFDPAKMEEHWQKHVAKEKELLHIKPAQESAWQSYVTATKPTPPPEHHGDWAAMEKMTEPERMEKMLGHLKEMEGKMQTHLAALKQLYAVLSPEQRTIFEISHHHHGGWGGHGRGGWGHHGGMHGHGPGGHGPGHEGGPPKE